MGDAHHQRTSAAQVLTKADLLYPIFTFVYLASDKPNLSLAQCATVCCAFHEPAIRVLWRNLSSLLPLWHLLAPSNTSFDTAYYSTTRYDVLNYLEQVISAQLYRDPCRWDRFLRYTAHVRVVTHGTHMAQGVNEANRLLMQAVIRQNGGNTVFPLLRTIRWIHPVDDTLTTFFTPTLRHATFIFMEQVKAETVSLLRKMRDSCPFLEKIDLDPGSEPDIALSIMKELASFPRLQEVEVSGCWEFEAFQVLATKPNLRRLSIPTISGPWGPHEVISVRDLRELSVGGDLLSLSCLFRPLRFYALESANIVVDSSEAETELTAADITNLLALFNDAISTSALQSFEFSPWPHRYEAPFDVKPPLRELIAPILSIRDLRSFTLITKYPVAGLDDTDIDALASAWPKLEHLSVHRGFTSESRVSINAIHVLYRRCMHLQQLSVPHILWPTIGVDAIPAPLDRSPAHPLQELFLTSQIFAPTALPLPGADLPDDGVEAVARYLFDLFPRLDLQRCKRIWDESRPPRLSAMRRGTNSASRRRLFANDLHFDDRWWKVVGHICSLCRARDGL